jgi:hypothetical protein
MGDSGAEEPAALRWPWPLGIRLLVAALGGWVLANVAVRPEVPWWRAGIAAIALALAAAAATSADRFARRGLWTGLAVATSLGLYVGVPETNHILGLAAGLLVLWLADLSGRLRINGLLVLAIDATLVWAAVWGASARPGAVVGGLALLGLLLVMPIVRVAPGPIEALVPPSWHVTALIGLQVGFAVAVGRLAALRESAAEAGMIALVGLAGLVALSRLVIGRQQP